MTPFPRQPVFYDGGVRRDPFPPAESEDEGEGKGDKEGVCESTYRGRVCFHWSRALSRRVSVRRQTDKTDRHPGDVTRGPLQKQGGRLEGKGEGGRKERVSGGGRDQRGYRTPKHRPSFPTPSRPLRGRCDFRPVTGSRRRVSPSLGPPSSLPLPRGVNKNEEGEGPLNGATTRDRRNRGSFLSVGNQGPNRITLGP